MEEKKSNSVLKKTATGAILLALCATLTGCSHSIIDTKYGLDRALIVGDDTAITMDISQWRDYEGEQVQLRFKDGRGFLTSYTNTTLVYSKDEAKVDAIAKSFAGEELGNGVVYTFK